MRIWLYRQSNEILGAEFDSDGTLVVVVANTGQFPVSGVEVYVNGEQVEVTNGLPERMEKGEVRIIDTDYQASGPAVIGIKAGKAEAEATFNLT